MVSAREALVRLQEGNRRFAAGEGGSHGLTSQMPPPELAAGQKPFAVILGCSDSRVPPEIVFDQGFGDLFVIRVAGNIVGPSQIGSVEFAAERLGTRLVVVLGHTGCGAVLATLDELRYATGSRTGYLGSIIDRVRPSVEALLATGLEQDPEALVRRAVRANIWASTSQLRCESEVLGALIRDDGLLIVGAEYSLDSRAVEFFDDMSEVR